MDTNDKLWDETISIGMSAKGWMVVHAVLVTALRVGPLPSKITGLLKKLQEAIEGILRRKGLLNDGDIRKLHGGR